MTKRQIVLLAGDKMPDGYKSCGYKNCFEEQCKGNCTFPEPISPMKETEQTLLDQVIEDVAKENHGYKHDRSLVNYSFWKIVCERYATAKAKASCEATLNKAAENVKSIHDPFGYFKDIDKSSITDPSNIVIVSPVNQNSNGEQNRK